MQNIGIIAGIGRQASTYYRSQLTDPRYIFHHLDTATIIKALREQQLSIIEKEIAHAVSILSLHSCNTIATACVSLQLDGVRSAKRMRRSSIPISQIVTSTLDDGLCYGVLGSKLTQQREFFEMYAPRSRFVWPNKKLMDCLDATIFNVAMMETVSLTFFDQLKEYFLKDTVDKIIIGCTDLTTDRILAYDWGVPIVNIPLLHIEKIKQTQ